VAAGNTYTPIATQTLGTTAASVTFSSISGAYTDLVLVMTYRSTRSAVYAYPIVRFNGDSGSNYSTTYLYGDGSSAVSARAANQSSINVYEAIGNNAASGTYGQINMSIQNYSNSTTYKTVLSRGGSSQTSAVVATQSSLWRSTSAITSIVIADGNSFDIMAGSTFSLYGIAAA